MLSFHVKFVQTDRRTDGWTDGQTDNGKTICPPPPIFRYGGIKMTKILIKKRLKKVHYLKATTCIQKSE